MVCSTIREIITYTSQKYGEADAVRYKISKNEIGAKSYQALRTDSERFSAALKELGEQGQHVALTGMTSYAWLVAYFGIVNSKSVAVPLDVSLPAAEMCDLIDRADATVFVADEVRADVIAAAKESCPKLKYIISMQKEESSPEVLSFWQLVNGQEPGFSCEVQPDDLATIMFTSGTTGKSKGVMLTHRNMAENATCLDMKFEEHSVLLSVLPIHHAYCLSMDILKGLSTGAVICINDSLIRMAKNIRLFKPNIILMV